jgi:16S rRNA G966 N2-methylase RsmD
VATAFAKQSPHEPSPFRRQLGWLRDTKELPDPSVDLVHLDPPFNSNADQNVLFREASGEASATSSQRRQRGLLRRTKRRGSIFPNWT